MVTFNGETLQIEGSVDSWDGNDDLAIAEKVARETGDEFRRISAIEASTFDELMKVWNAWNRAREKVQRLRAEYDLHEDRSESCRQDAEVEAQADAAELA